MRRIPTARRSDCDPAVTLQNIPIMKMLKSSRSWVPAAALLVILWFFAAPFARAQSGKPVPGELKVPPGKEAQSSPDATATGKGEGKDKDKGKDDDKEPPPSVTEHTLTVG